MMEFTEDDIFQSSENEYSEEEKEILQSIKRDKHSQQLHTQIEKAIKINNEIKLLKNIDVEKSFNKTKYKIRKQRRINLGRIAMRYAAILSIPLFISTLYFGYRDLNKEMKHIGTTTVRAMAGTIVRHELPDRSIVWLNSESEISYPENFNQNNRKLFLSGEAYFEVESDPKNPFYVNTDKGMDVYVYGTKFNVCAYNDMELIEASLESGKINAIIPQTNSEIRLNPGEHICFDAKSGEVSRSNVDIYEKTAWKEGKLIFRNTSLEEVFKRLEKHFNVDIQFNNYADKEYKYRATFRNETITQILDYLSQSASLKWKIEDSKQQTDGSFTKNKIIIDLYK